MDLHKIKNPADSDFDWLRHIPSYQQIFNTSTKLRILHATNTVQNKLLCSFKILLLRYPTWHGAKTYMMNWWLN